MSSSDSCVVAGAVAESREQAETAASRAKAKGRARRLVMRRSVRRAGRWGKGAAKLQPVAPFDADDRPLNQLTAPTPRRGCHTPEDSSGEWLIRAEAPADCA